MAGNNGGPWGGGSNGGDDDRDEGRDQRPGGNKPGGAGPELPDIDELLNKSREGLRVLLGGGKGGGGANGAGGGGGDGIGINRTTVGIAAVAVAALWAFASFYTVKPEEKSVELFLGKYSQTGEPGLNFAPWPVVRAEVLAVSTEQTIEIGTGRTIENAGLMLTGDENIVDIDFQVVWNISDPQKFLFNLAGPEETIAAVAESAMREIIAQSDLAPILNRDRGVIATALRDLIQETLDSYDSGVFIVRINFEKADPPESVIASFRRVQDAEQERDRLRNLADAEANRVLGAARGEAAQILEESEAYRALVVNEAEGEASRFLAVLEEYSKAPEVTRKRLYLETMEQVLGSVSIILLDEGAAGGQGVVPYLPLNELRRSTTTPAEGSN